MFEHPQALVSMALIGLLVVFSMYRRVRRNIGPQPFQPRRMMFRIGLFVLIPALMLTAVLSVAFSWSMIAAAAAGAIAGGALGIYAAHVAKLEGTPDGVFYTGNMYIGLAVTALLIARIGYRLIGTATTIDSAVAHTGGPPMPPQSAFASSVGNPLTLGIMLVTFGYYIAYYGGLLLKARKSGIS